MLQNATYNEIETALNNGFSLFHVFTPAGFIYVASIELPTVPGAFIIAKIPTAKIKNGWRNYVGLSPMDAFGRACFYWIND